ncbi:ShlB/FhaC/HecB family hemolysin secretion/activation protein [Luteolibacter marinus]|uniref:ShlB/FhaC/HecB family hemolysin secretion/activation protein n=1 Tax=Luteolibacter marinus TaxID=2776705 RepID=UPI0018684870|nr:ShlB/FhaC/HecB family hemolysin secretion/activation protein [Luteolibacter marinus]
MRLLIVIGLIASARSQSLPGVEARVPEAPEVESLPAVSAGEGSADEGDELARRLERVVLTTRDGGAETGIGEGVAATDGLDVPSPRTLAARLGPWLGRPLTGGGLAALADEILIHYDVEGFPIVSLEVPEQDLSGGVLRIQVEIGRYGEVGVSRPKHGNPTAVQKGLLLRRGAVVRRSDIDEQMAWYGRTPFRHPRLFVSPGLEPATADLLIAFEEGRPWRVTLGYENSGPDLLGRDRLLLGVAGVTPGEHLLAWQSVVGMPASSLFANALRWEVPFHALHQVLQVDAAYAEVASRYASSGMPVESEGSSWALTAMQKVPLPAIGRWRQAMGAGFELKGTDQFLLFGGDSVAPGEVVLFHGKLSHELSRRWARGGASMESSLVVSPGGLGGNNTDAAFKAYDPTVDASYVIGRMNGSGWWRPAGDWQVRVRGEIQVADSRLLPAEQFAAGGYQTVRGAGEREYFADNGWQGSLELYSPLIEAGEAASFRVLTFFDYAALDDRGGPSSSLSGAGLGLRMKLAGRADLRFDHGWRLDEEENRSHLGVSFTF